ncbi:hypothetical protein BpHYR1_046443 [Brachionus plicatilis]|uniref:Uncharacterized protein n=1 Tax=Brachionus plicatilis TaxID=10195 RepID=A0A3M7RH82_BRAPC|nr:hypothetical protein BpHYR1_046443 [Brachionus plicatilis]
MDKKIRIGKASRGFRRSIGIRRGGISPTRLDTTGNQGIAHRCSIRQTESLRVDGKRRQGLVLFERSDRSSGGRIAAFGRHDRTRRCRHCIHRVHSLVPVLLLDHCLAYQAGIGSRNVSVQLDVFIPVFHGFSKLVQAAKLAHQVLDYVHFGDVLVFGGHFGRRLDGLGARVELEGVYGQGVDGGSGPGQNFVDTFICLVEVEVCEAEESARLTMMGYCGVSWDESVASTLAFRSVDEHRKGQLITLLSIRVRDSRRDLCRLVLWSSGFLKLWDAAKYDPHRSADKFRRVTFSGRGASISIRLSPKFSTLFFTHDRKRSASSSHINLKP